MDNINTALATPQNPLPWYLDTTKLITHCRFGAWVWLPISAVVFWFTGLLILLLIWVNNGQPRYTSNSADIVFISEVGAANETFFFIICLIVIILYFSTIVVTAWLRGKGRLPGTRQLTEKICSGLAIIFCFIGCSGLFILSKWNCWDYKKVHWYGTLVFISGIAISAIFQTIEVWFLSKEHPDRKHLLRNGILKLLVVITSVVLASTFGGVYMYCKGKAVPVDGHTFEQCDRSTSAAAVLEWTIAFGLNLYFMTLVADLWPSAKSSPRYLEAVRKYEAGLLKDPENPEKKSVGDSSESNKYYQ
ncbi:uncharacterized protein IL334_006402 [Kwoniella shivajii]|uniref:CWH43-like N-terminal domain-containing protein n=1 Tax=Kwoniella shivajii TaxID=564305 RepID=A0ABZ1D5V0_9TREE|nr:hypothetical protein IL334_006402 [Kwoniella shivajii]